MDRTGLNLNKCSENEKGKMFVVVCCECGNDFLNIINKDHLLSTRIASDQILLQEERF